MTFVALWCLALVRFNGMSFMTFVAVPKQRGDRLHPARTTNKEGTDFTWPGQQTKRGQAPLGQDNKQRGDKLHLARTTNKEGTGSTWPEQQTKRGQSPLGQNNKQRGDSLHLARTTNKEGTGSTWPWDN